MLRELDHVFKQTYFNLKNVTDYLRGLVRAEKLVGDDPCAFWRRTNFLEIQCGGNSQVEMLALFNEVLREQCGFEIKDCGHPDGDYIYLDDILFSGSRVGNDLDPWIRTLAPSKANIHVVVLAMHTLGDYLLGKRLDQTVKESGKSVKLHYWRALVIENRKYHRNNSDVLWPIEMPEDAATKAYASIPQKFPLEFRVAGGKLGPFSSESGRQLLEREFLIAGVKIRSLSQHPKDVLRPLGFSPFGVGFGSLIATFRNCPNNCPLALWWGDPSATSGPFHWYPLLQRTTNSQTAIGRLFANLAKEESP